MGGPDGRDSFTNESSLKKFLGLRMIVLALVVGAGVMIMQLSLEDFSGRPLYVLLVASYLTGALLLAGLRMGVSMRSALWALMITDVLLETAILHYSGGATSQFSLIFCLSIIAAALLLQVRGGLGIAFLASFCYVCYGVLQARGVMQPLSISDEPVKVGFLETYMHVSLFFLVGAIGGYVGERTQRKGDELESAETELEQLKFDTANIINNMTSGVLVLDSEGRVLTINPTAERILGVIGDDIAAMDIETAFDHIVPEFAVELRRTLDSGESRVRHELTLRRPGKRDLPLGASLSMLRDQDGHKRGVIALFQDLTEVRDMEERVRRADRLAAIGELSAGIAHEIRNPLASISGSIEMLSNELELSGEDKRLMELVMKESDRLDRIISEFLEFARLRPPTRDMVSVKNCLDDVLTLVGKHSGLKSSAEITVNHIAGDITVRFDEEQMKQVFLNLVINALEAMEDGGMLVIETDVIGEDWLRLVFRDGGPGIDDEARTRLFEPFFTTKQGGTGLGLAIANKIIEAHAGKIEARNRDEGGAEFTLFFPVVKVGEDSEQLDNVGSFG